MRWVIDQNSLGKLIFLPAAVWWVAWMLRRCYPAWTWVNNRINQNFDLSMNTQTRVSWKARKHSVQSANAICGYNLLCKLWWLSDISIKGTWPSLKQQNFNRFEEKVVWDENERLLVLKIVLFVEVLNQRRLLKKITSDQINPPVFLVVQSATDVQVESSKWGSIRRKHNVWWQHLSRMKDVLF